MDGRLKDSEWIILRALWGEEPLDMKRVVERVQAQNPALKWDYKTYHSFLRMLCAKGLIGAKREGRSNRYYPLVSERQALSLEADSLAERRGYYGSVSSLMVSMAERGKLTAEEKRELMALAERLSREEGP